LVTRCFPTNGALKAGYIEFAIPAIALSLWNFQKVEPGSSGLFFALVRIVLPGSSGETNFRETARARLRGIEDEAYGEFMKQAIARMMASTGPGTRATDVAEAVWRAATDPPAPLHIPAGAEAR
jgi:hypothetical protein